MKKMKKYPMKDSVLNDNKLQEPYTPYGSTAVASHYGSSFWDEMHTVPAADKITIIKKGISKKELEAVKEESCLDYDTLSNILSVSKAKLHGKKGAERFDQNTSERIMLLADVIAYGQSVFEDKESFNEWLKTSNMALGNVSPVELMDTMYGIDEVKKEIGRIEYGVF
ncbi:antitoxin Xre/MbcA/ParS toxin-binding domain-containing protein [Parafilimonas sp.]|uniref:type II RES/Xre toxin-antitoxin system antitoxin n=1 Tax=Parafilimonas sp. TaxID=1969739 RepID=UPI0039E3EB64